MDVSQSDFGNSKVMGDSQLMLPSVKNLSSKSKAEGSAFAKTQKLKNMYGYDDPTKALEKMLG